MTSEDPRQRLTEWFRVLREPLRRFIAGRRRAGYLDSDDVAQEVFLRLLRHADD
jgi:DNA-directed RNA polymerase specialized sigma24 family protein